jgi:hypothetical protein
VRPAEVADESPAPDALSDEQEQVLLLQSAINKTYRHKLLEFRRSVTPDMLDGMRATMPPELVPELDALLREAAALSDDEVAEFEAATAAAEAAAAVAGAAQAVVEADAVTGPGAAGDGLMFEDDPSQQAGPYSLSPEEHAAWQMIQDPNLPEDFMRWGRRAGRTAVEVAPLMRLRFPSWRLLACDGGWPAENRPCRRLKHPKPRHRSYLADMLPENTSEVEVQQLLDRLPDGVVGELQVGTRERRLLGSRRCSRVSLANASLASKLLPQREAAADRAPLPCSCLPQELFFELKEFEASDESDMEAISKRVGAAPDALQLRCWGTARRGGRGALHVDACAPQRVGMPALEHRQRAAPCRQTTVHGPYQPHGPFDGGRGTARGGGVGGDPAAAAAGCTVACTIQRERERLCAHWAVHRPGAAAMAGGAAAAAAATAARAARAGGVVLRPS